MPAPIIPAHSDRRRSRPGLHSLLPGNRVLATAAVDFSVVTVAATDVSGRAKVAESVDALVLGASGATRESSSLSFRTNFAT